MKRRDTVVDVRLDSAIDQISIQLDFLVSLHANKIMLSIRSHLFHINMFP